MMGRHWQTPRTGATMRLVIGGELKLGELGPNLAIVTSPSFFGARDSSTRLDRTDVIPPPLVGLFRVEKGNTD